MGLLFPFDFSPPPYCHVCSPFFRIEDRLNHPGWDYSITSDGVAQSHSFLHSGVWSLWTSLAQGSGRPKRAPKCRSPALITELWNQDKQAALYTEHVLIAHLKQSSQSTSVCRPLMNICSFGRFHMWDSLWLLQLLTEWLQRPCSGGELGFISTKKLCHLISSLSWAWSLLFKLY